MSIKKQPHAHYIRTDELPSQAPLAWRMRPRDLSEFMGQGHILGPGRLLRRAIEADRVDPFRIRIALG